jgi:hypothetical protein
MRIPEREEALGQPVTALSRFPCEDPEERLSAFQRRGGVLPGDQAAVDDDEALPVRGFLVAAAEAPLGVDGEGVSSVGGFVLDDRGATPSGCGPTALRRPGGAAFLPS